MAVQDLIGQKFTNLSGYEYEVLEFIERKGCKYYYKVRFLETGYERVAEAYNIRQGNVKDNQAKMDKINEIVGNVYKNGAGLEFKVLEFVGHRGEKCDKYYKIKFLESGYETEVPYKRIKDGSIKDPIYHEATYINGIVGKHFFNNDGLEYEVLEFVGRRGDYNDKYYRVRFLESGYETEAQYSNIVYEKSVRDHIAHDNKHIDHIIGEKFISNSGLEYIVEKFLYRDNNSKRHYRIRFTESSGTLDVAYDHILSGEVKDRLAKTVCGIGVIGYPTIEDYSTTREYRVWIGMIRRCYDINDCNYSSYGAKGVRVCDRWLRFDCFYSDVPFIDGYDKELFESGQLHLDKDIKQIGMTNKIYSPQTCTFLSPEINVDLARNPNDYIGWYEQVQHYETPAYIIPAIINKKLN